MDNAHVTALRGLSYIPVNQFEGYALVRLSDLAGFVQDRENDAAARARGITWAQLLTVKEVARFLKVSDQHVVNLVNSGRLEAADLRSDPELRGMLRIRPESVQAYLADQQVRPVHKQLTISQRIDEKRKERAWNLKSPTK
jgi:excisionase family DNA binding protein